MCERLGRREGEFCRGLLALIEGRVKDTDGALGAAGAASPAAGGSFGGFSGTPRRLSVTALLHALKAVTIDVVLAVFVTLLIHADRSVVIYLMAQRNVGDMHVQVPLPVKVLKMRFKAPTTYTRVGGVDGVRRDIRKTHKLPTKEYRSLSRYQLLACFALVARCVSCTPRVYMERSVRRETVLNTCGLYSTFSLLFHCLVHQSLLGKGVLQMASGWSHSAVVLGTWLRVGPPVNRRLVCLSLCNRVIRLTPSILVGPFSRSEN
jgi:hypothetical protein